jgi:hypothetical protein
MHIEFESIVGDGRQIAVLYDLLARRNHTISHAQMPGYDQHSDFVKCNPYLCWYLIKVDGSYVGSFYITDQNSIGINITDDWIGEILSSVITRIKSHFRPLPAIRSVRGEFFSINVAPNNAKLIDALERNRCVLAQLTYVIK